MSISGGEMKATALMLRFPPSASTSISVGLQHTMSACASPTLHSTVQRCPVELGLLSYASVLSPALGNACQLCVSQDKD